MLLKEVLFHVTAIDICMKLTEKASDLEQLWENRPLY